MDSIWKKLYIFVCMKDRHESIEKVFSAIKSGDQRVFERVFRMFYVPLCDYAAMILGEQAEAEDVVQDLFMHIWRSRVEIEVQDSVKSYLFTSVRFRALNVLKHKMVERKHGALLTEFIEGLQRSDYSEEEMQQIEQIKKVLQELPTQCRVVFTMSCLEGKKYKDIANEGKILLLFYFFLSPVNQWINDIFVKKFIFDSPFFDYWLSCIKTKML